MKPLNNIAFFDEELDRIRKRRIIPVTWLEQPIWLAKVFSFLALSILVIVGVINHDINDVRFTAYILILCFFAGFFTYFLLLQMTWLDRKKSLVKLLGGVILDDVIEYFDTVQHLHLVFTKYGFYSQALKAFQSYNEPLYRVKKASYNKKNNELELYTQVHRFYKTISFQLPADWEVSRSEKLANTINQCLVEIHNKKMEKYGIQ